MCDRNENGGKDNKHITNSELSLEDCTKIFSPKFISQLDTMYMCGNLGDPIVAKDTLEVFRYFREHNPTMWLSMNTNAGARDTAWWTELAKIFNNKGAVIFSVDGLADTNHLYRQNVKWGIVENSMRSFINAGGRARWDYIIFEHNQHQVEECEQLARDMGFKWFRAKVSKRELYESQLQMPSGWQLPVVGQGPIQCHVLKEKSAYIDAQGRLSPCCWLGGSQSNTITDIKQVQTTWKSITPNSTCQSACGTIDSKTSFSSQWQREVEFV